MAANAGADDLVLFAFIGNGGSLGELGDRRCYFAADSTFKGRARNAVAAAEIGGALKDLKTQRFAAFVDVDFKGFDAPLGQRPFPAVPLDRLFLGGDRQPWGAEDSPLPGRALFLATDGVTVPVDLETSWLVHRDASRRAEGGGGPGRGEPDGFVTVPELIEHLVRRRPQRINEEGDADTTPRFLYAGDPAATFVLSRNPEVMPRVRTRLARLETLVRDGSVPARYAAEAKAFLERMPAGQVQAGFTQGIPEPWWTGRSPCRPSSSAARRSWRRPVFPKWRASLRQAGHRGNATRSGIVHQGAEPG